MKIFTGVLILSLALTGCKKDKDKGPSNYFKVGATVYEVSAGTLENYGTDAANYEGYNLDLTLMSSGIDVDQYGSWSGTGKAIYFETYSTSGTILPSGEYTYDYVSDIPPTFTFDYADYCINWTTSNHTWVYLVAGTITVVRDGNNYTIDLTGGIDLSANAVTAHYSGTLEYFDYSAVKSAKNKH